MKTESDLIKEFINSDKILETLNIFALQTYYAIMKDLGYTFRLEECTPRLVVVYYVGYFEIKSSFDLDKGIVRLEKV